jgi:hypothetical protein
MSKGSTHRGAANFCLSRKETPFRVDTPHRSSFIWLSRQLTFLFCSYSTALTKKTRKWTKVYINWDDGLLTWGFHRQRDARSRHLGVNTKSTSPSGIPSPFIMNKARERRYTLTCSSLSIPHSHVQCCLKFRLFKKSAANTVVLHYSFTLHMYHRRTISSKDATARCYVISLMYRRALNTHFTYFVICGTVSCDKPSRETRQGSVWLHVLTATNEMSVQFLQTIGCNVAQHRHLRQGSIGDL